MTPEQIIARALRHDQQPTSEARRVIDALHAAGYAITPLPRYAADLDALDRPHH